MKEHSFSGLTIISGRWRGEAVIEIYSDQSASEPSGSGSSGQARLAGGVVFVCPELGSNEPLRTVTSSINFQLCCRKMIVSEINVCMESVRVNSGPSQLSH